MSSMDDYYDAEMIDRLTAAACENAELKAERDRLREAIEKHRRDMWGNGVVGHLYDKNLYAALQEDRDDT